VHDRQHLPLRNRDKWAMLGLLPGPSDHPRHSQGPGPKAPLDAAQAVDRASSTLARVQGCVRDASAHVARAREQLSSGCVVSAAGLERTQESLRSAATSLDALSELVHASMQSRATGLGSPLLSRARPVSLAQALDHAREVLQPIARQHNITIDVRCHSSLTHEPARTLYSVLLNTMTNAVEAVLARRDDPACLRTVHVELSPSPPPRQLGKAPQRAKSKLSLAGAAPSAGAPASPSHSTAWICLEVTDDGVGLPGHMPAQQLCELGTTTKPGGAGVGLAVASSIVRGLGGELTLSPRASGTRGTMLRAVFPAAVQSVRQSA
jgi:signal transduction histidine kinase